MDQTQTRSSAPKRSAEEPVVGVRVVPVELVRVRKELVSEHRELKAELRREQVELGELPAP